MSDKKGEKIVPQLLPIQKTTEMIKETILTNVIKMLTERKILNYDKLEQNIKNVVNTKSDEMLFKVPIDNPINLPSDAKTYIIKIINQKITSVSKSSGIADFLNQYKNVPKIVIISNVSTKLLYGIKNDQNYPYTEFFLEQEMMINVIDHIAVPKHILLSEDELKKVLEEYGARRREIQQIYITDAIARYYNVKVGQMFKIIRPSETAGFSPTYRIVIPGNVMDI